MSEYDRRTLQFYEESALTYLASGHGGVSRHLEAFLTALPPHSIILELGCGGGRDAQAMIAAGHRVEPIDGSKSIARKAENLLGVPVRVMRFEELSSVNVYDAIWANASLLHVPRSSLPVVLAKVRAALKSGGLHHATYKGGGREGRDTHGRYFNYLTSKEVVDMYERSGRWDIVTVLEYMGGGYQQSVPGPWVAITARKSR